MTDNSGVALTKCFFCGADNELLLNTRIHNSILNKKVSEMHGKVINMNPCNQCKDYMTMGIMLISVRDGEVGSQNPYRTGRICVVKEQAIRNIGLPKELEDKILKSRWTFIDDTVWSKLGLPMTQMVHQ